MKIIMGILVIICFFFNDLACRINLKKYDSGTDKYKRERKKFIIFYIISAIAAAGSFIIALNIEKLTINNILVATLTVAGIFIGVMFCVYFMTKLFHGLLIRNGRNNNKKTTSYDVVFLFFLL